MTKKLPLLRPATSAMAAFLVLSTPAAFAQTAPAETTPPAMAPEPVAPPVVMVPPVAAPAPQTTQPATTAPAPVIRVPLDVAPPATETTPKVAEPQAEAAPAPRAERQAKAAPAERTREPAAAPASPATEPAAPATAAASMLAEDSALTPPLAAPVAEPADPVVAQRADAGGDAFPWEIAGGAAALLLAGGAAFALMRRRRTDGVAEETRYEDGPVADPAPEAHRAPVITAPPAKPRSTPAFATAPHGSMGRHEALAMAGPSEDNPFLTLKKRLKRARFYDRRERMDYDALLAEQKDMRRQPASAWDIAQRPEPAPAQQDVHRPDTRPARPGLRPGFAKG